MLGRLPGAAPRYTGQTDILIGSPVAGRSRPAFERIVGNFINMVVLQSRPVRRFAFRRSLGQAMSGRVLGALAHQDFPFPLLVERLVPARSSAARRSFR